MKKDVRKKRSIIWIIEKEKLAELVKNNVNIISVLRELGVGRRFTYYYKAFKQRLEQDNIDYSHFKRGGFGYIRRTPLQTKEICTEHSTYSRTHLKARLLKNGLMKNICSVCGQKDKWKGKHLIMILDHINGVHDDHRLENLRMVCPNCNSQLDTQNGKNKKK